MSALPAVGSTGHCVDPRNLRTGHVPLYRRVGERTKPKCGPLSYSTFMCGAVSAAEATLMAHMDTVLPLGSLAKKPFRVEGHKAYGRGIGDDKLKKTGFTGYREVTVLIGADEVISTPGTRGLIRRLAAEHDAVLDCEPSGPGGTSLVLATSDTGGAILNRTRQGLSFRYCTPRRPQCPDGTRLSVTTGPGSLRPGEGHSAELDPGQSRFRT